MEDNTSKNVEFIVTVCLGGGDGGDVCVTVPVSEEEYSLLKECYQEEMDIYDYEGLEDLVERIESEAKDEADYLSDGEDYGDPSFIIYFSDEFMNEE